MFFGMNILHPGYGRILFEDPAGQKMVNGQIAELKSDMAQMGINVNVVSDTTVKNLDPLKIVDSFVSGAFNIVAATSQERGNATSSSGSATGSKGQHFVGAVLNETKNMGHRDLMTHEVLHFLNRDYGTKNPGSWAREFRVDRQVWKLHHPRILKYYNLQPFRDVVKEIP